MPRLPRPPAKHQQFTERFPTLAEAWRLLGAAAKEGPLSDREVRLAKLAVAIGAMHEGAVHANVRKALALGITPDEIEQVVAAAAGTLGLPSVVAVYTWVGDCLRPDGDDGPAR